MVTINNIQRFRNNLQNKLTITSTKSNQKPKIHSVNIRTKSTIRTIQIFFQYVLLTYCIITIYTSIESRLTFFICCAIGASFGIDYG